MSETFRLDAQNGLTFMNANAYTARNSDFTENIDVVCPKCEQKAAVVGARVDQPVAEYEEHVRFSCMSCGYAVKYINTPKFTVFVNSRGKAVHSRILLMNTDCDPFFGFRLWYIVETPYGALWAYNLAHLTVIEQYIADKKRERNGLPNKNNSLASRLPQWAKHAKHRELLLRLIQRAKA